MNSFRLRTVVALALGLVLVASAATATHPDAVLGSGGDLYQAKVGTYGDLFKGSKEYDRTTPVLALEVVKPDGSVQRSLVPGTEGAELEASPFLQYEELSDTVFLVWKSQRTAIHPSLRLSAFNGTWLWQEPINIIGNPLASKTPPQISVTRDTYQDGDTIRHRSILHVFWGEESGSGLLEAFYTPIILDDGAFTGRSPVIKLNDFDKSEALDASVEAGAELFPALRIQGGRDERTVVVAFAYPESRRVSVVEIDSLPADLSRLADEARAQIIELGGKPQKPSRATLASQVRTKILEIGSAFHPEVLQAIAEHVYKMISKADENAELKVVADGARAQIIELGGKLSGRGLRGSNAASTASEIQEIATDSSAFTEEDGPPSHLIQFRLASSRPVPETGTDGLRMFVSEDGENLIVAWVDGDRVLYRESSGGGWKDSLEIKLSATLDQTRAFEILEQRVRNH